MKTTRYGRVQEIYNQLIAVDIMKLAEDEDIDPQELKKILEQMSPKTEPAKPGEEKPVEPVEVEKEPEVKVEKKPDFQMPSSTTKTPQMGFTFAGKKYSPGAVIAKECPICTYKNRPVFINKCKKCEKIYQKLLKAKNQGVSLPKVLRHMSEQTGLSIDRLQTIWESEGNTLLSTKSIVSVEPSLGKSLDDIINYRFNVQKDETGEPKVDEDGIPIPLSSPIYFTTKQLSLALRLTPDAFIQMVDDYNKSHALSGRDTVNPAYQAGTGRADTSKGFKSEFLAVWNFNKVKHVFADRLKELEEKILPEEKIEKIKHAIASTQDKLEEDAAGQSILEQHKLEYSKKVPKKKYLAQLNKLRNTKDAEAKKALEAEYGATASELEKNYGKLLDTFAKIVDDKNRQVKILQNKQAKGKEKLEALKKELITTLEKHGFAKFDVAKEVAEKEAEEEEKKEAGKTARINNLHNLLRYSAKQTGLFGDEPEEEEPVELKGPTGNIGYLTEPQQGTDPRKVIHEMSFQKDKKRIVPKLVLILRKKKEEGKITEDELSELNYLEEVEKNKNQIELLREEILILKNDPKKKNELHHKQEILKELEDFISEEVSVPKAKALPKGSEESGEFTRHCPVKGCGAVLTEEAKTCWKCKSPVAKNEIRLITMRKIKNEVDTKEKNPETGRLEDVTKDVYFPVYSLVTFKTDEEGNPVSAKCEKLGMTSIGTREVKVPTHPELIQAIKESMGFMSKEDKEKIKKNFNKVYETYVESKGLGSPWKMIRKPRYVPGLPKEPCKLCPTAVSAPFEDACGDIKNAIKYLTGGDLGYGTTVQEYDKVREAKPDEGGKPSNVTDFVPQANDKEARFNKILNLYKNS